MTRTRVAEEVRTLGLAVAFLTRVPLAVAAPPERLGAMLRYLPAVGGLIGGVAAAVLVFAAAVFPPVVAVLLAVAATAALTGALHEDGLADTFDGVGGGGDRERVLAIMRDSRIGTYGALGLGLTVALKVAALGGMAVPTAAAALVAGHAASRLSALVVVASSRYAAAAGTGSFTAGRIGPGSLAVASGVVVAVLAACLPILGFGGVLAAVAGLAVGHLAARVVFERRLGGYAGDSLGATQQLSELGFYLGLLAWL